MEGFAKMNRFVIQFHNKGNEHRYCKLWESSPINVSITMQSCNLKYLDLCNLFNRTKSPEIINVIDCVTGQNYHDFYFKKNKNFFNYSLYPGQLITFLIDYKKL